MQCHRLGRQCDDRIQRRTRFVAAKALDGQRQPLLGMLGNSQDAPREIELLRPKMQQRLLALAAHFPRHARKRRDTTAVLADFDDPGAGKLLEAGLQFDRKFHANIINAIRGWWTIYFEVEPKSR